MAILKTWPHTNTTLYFEMTTHEASPGMLKRCYYERMGDLTFRICMEEFQFVGLYLSPERKRMES